MSVQYHHVLITQDGTNILTTQTGNYKLSPQIVHIPHILLQDGTNSLLLQDGMGDVALQPPIMLPRIRHGGIMRTIF